jgi:hypothetical protein
MSVRLGSATALDVSRSMGFSNAPDGMDMCIFDPRRLARLHLHRSVRRLLLSLAVGIQVTHQPASHLVLLDSQPM